MSRLIRLSFFLPAAVILVLALLSARPALAQTQDPSWRAEFFNGVTLSGAPIHQRNDRSIDFDWGYGSPSWSVPADNFSARWTRRYVVPQGTYRFLATADDGMRVYVDNALIMDAWYSSAEHTTTRDYYLTEGEHLITVEYFETSGKATARFSFAPAVGGDFYPNWRGEYFNNTDTAGFPVVVRDDRYLDFDWGMASPIPGVINKDNFSVRWTRTLPMFPGQYRVSVTSDDGVRVYIDNRTVIDNWRIQAATKVTQDFFTAGGSVPVQVDYFDAANAAKIRLDIIYVPNSGETAPPPGGGGGGAGGGQCPQPNGFVAVTSGSVTVNVRSGPGTTYPIIDTLPQCSVMPLTGYRSEDSAWVQIYFPDGTPGWVTINYVELGVPLESLIVLPDSGVVEGGPGDSSGGSGGSGSGNFCPPPQGPVAVSIIPQNLNVRTGPGNQFPILTTVPTCTVMNLTGFRNADGSWIQVSIPNSSNGWVFTDYVALGVPVEQLSILEDAAG